MKRFLYTALLALVTVGLAEARPRPGGGGGGVGGGFHPRPNPGAGVAPRPTPRPSAGPKPGTMPAKPGIGGGNPRPNIGVGGGPGPIKPRPGTLPAKPGGNPAHGDIGKFLGSPPPGHFPGTAGYRPGYTGYHKAEFHTNIHNHFPYHPGYGYPFSKDWCAHFHWHYNNWPYWAGAATAVTLTRWIGVGAYSGYGAAEQVPYYPVEPAPVNVYEQSVTAPVQLAEEGKKAQVPDDTEWMNIGTFGIIPYQAKDMAFGVQLATTKDGVVRGIQWDMKTNTQVEVAGSIQKDTLKIAWQPKVADGLTFETNVDELTQQESMVNVYNPVTKSLVSWQLIQIDQADLPPAK